MAIESPEVARALRSLSASGYASARKYWTQWIRFNSFDVFSKYLSEHPLSPELEALVKQQIIINRLES